MTPAFFGSALTNFGLEPFFDAFVELAHAQWWGGLSVRNEIAVLAVIEDDLAAADSPKGEWRRRPGLANCAPGAPRPKATLSWRSTAGVRDAPPGSRVTLRPLYNALAELEKAFDK